MTETDFDKQYDKDLLMWKARLEGAGFIVQIKEERDANLLDLIRYSQQNRCVLESSMLANIHATDKLKEWKSKRGDK